jgi:CRISPR-associated protein Csx10
MSELTLTLRQPAQIGDRSREDFVVATLDYIPGTVVRGAFAAAWLARNGVSQPGTLERAEFLRLFEGGVRFGALLQAKTEFTPMSVAGHKYEANDNCAYREYDRARGDKVPSQCPQCDSPFEQIKEPRGGKPAKKRRTSVSIHESGVARTGQLFTRETLEAGQDFTGTIVAEDPRDLELLADLGPIRVGGRRTTHGLAAVTIGDTAPPPTAEVRPDGKLIIRLRSPGIFIDSRGYPIPEPDQAELRHVLGTDAKVDHKWIRWQQVGGWHAASGLPKPAELAVAPGSTYVISAEGVSQAALDELGRRGLGLRRHEGFGDLAPKPVLEDGKVARDAEQQAKRQLVISVAPMSGFPLRFPERWPLVRKALLGLIAGDEGQIGILQREAEDPPDASIGAALRTFLAMAPQDAAYVAGELTGE